MRKSLLMFLIIPISLGCKKSNNYNSLNSQLAGGWIYLYQVGGIAGKPTNFPMSGNTSLLVLSGNQTYRTLLNNKVQTDGSYSLGSVKSYFSGGNDNAIKFDSSADWQIIAVRNDTLTISDNYADGYGTIYIKEK